MVTGGFPIGLGLSWLINLLDDMAESRDSTKDMQERFTKTIFGLLSWLSVVLFFALLVAFMLARAYLVVECFINLSQLPAGVYDMPNWSAYFPHIA